MPSLTGALEPNLKSAGARFTLDGSDQLERHLKRLCDRVMEGIQSCIADSKVEGVVLAGGYGRGEGGVLRLADRDFPYNDLEFYLFLKGNRLLNERKYASSLEALGHRLSPLAGLDVEFKIDSFPRLRGSRVTMFSYDLVSRHRIIAGKADLFNRCEHHLDPRRIEAEEASHLLFNRCTGLLLAKERLLQPRLSAEDLDFLGRNLAKAQMALGDAVLALRGQYHWSCLERQARLAQLDLPPPEPWFPALKGHHAAGVAFKLHPVRNRGPIEELGQMHQEVSGLALKVWLWLESRRLNKSFSTPLQYATDAGHKCCGTAAWRNLLLNLRTFGTRAAADPLVLRYPRERLFSVLPLMLAGCESGAQNRELPRARRLLRASANDWAGLMMAYKQIWSVFR